jgi:site-specific DNA-methyltransferase (adenine-specific)
MKILNWEAILWDCMEEMKKMPDWYVEHVFTSPPYNRKRNDKYEFYDDTLVDYMWFLRESLKQCIRVSKGFVFLNIQKNYYNKSDVFKIIGEFSEEIVEIFIWEKINPMPASGFAITNAYEFFIIFWKSALKSNSTYTKNIISTSVNSNMPKEHSAVMKQEVSDWFIKKFTKEWETILDPFAWLFTTALSCEKFCRKWICIEKEKEYYDIWIKRLNNLSSLKL